MERLSLEEKNLIAALGRGTIKVELVEERLREIEEAREPLQKRLAEAEEELRTRGVEEINLDAVAANLERFRDCFDALTLEEKRGVVQGLIERVEVNGDNVTIKVYSGCVLNTNGQR